MHICIHMHHQGTSASCWIRGQLSNVAMSDSAANVLQAGTQNVACGSGKAVGHCPPCSRVSSLLAVCMLGYIVER